MGRQNKILLTIFLLICCVVFTSCTTSGEEIEQTKSYSNVYFSMNYPSEFEQELVAHKNLFSQQENQIEFDIQEYFYEDALDNIIRGHGAEESLIDGTKWYLIESETRVWYLAKKHGVLFQLTFWDKTGEYDELKVLSQQIVESIKFNDFEEMSFESWNQYSTENITVYYPDDSNIFGTVQEWTEHRIEAFDRITNYLNVEWAYGDINVFVFNSQEHGAQYGIQLGYALGNINQIYTLDTQSYGHELAHCISAKLNNSNTIESSLIEEGFAVFLDSGGSDCHVLASEIIKEQDSKPDLLGDKFWENDKGYPLGASFVQYLIDEYGLDLFKEFYAQNTYDEKQSFVFFYDKEGEVLIAEWLECIKN